MDSLNVRFVDKYFGPSKITNIAVARIKTPSGGYVFDVMLDDKKKKMIPEAALVAVATEEPKDHNYVRDKLASLIVPEVLKTLEEYDFNAMQVPYLLDMISLEVSNKINRAANWLWTKDDTLYAPGFNAMHDVTLLMAQSVISEIPHESGGTTKTD